MHVVATAGHVDHGKSTLVRALTGTDPDRLEEEHRRGLTIELGYCWTTLPDAGEVAFVDVPGHERFITTMLSGIGPVPAVLLVVAADDPWMPQAAEHLAALDALGVDRGILVVTRADLADPATMLARARAELAGTSLAGIPAVAVSAQTGQGLDELRRLLADLVRALPTPDPAADVRLWLDRSFHVKGAGTVVTGTLPAGRVAVGDTLAVGVHGAGGAGGTGGTGGTGGAGGQRLVRVRGVQSLGRPVEQATGVARVALNVAGEAVELLERSSVLVTPDRFHPASLVDVRVVDRPGPGPGPGPGLGSGSRSGFVGEVDRLPERPLLHVGATAVAVRCRRLGEGVARLSLDQPLPLRVGDRALLRDPGSRRLWGVAVLDPAAGPLPRRRGAAAGRARELADVAAVPDLAAEVARRGLVSTDLLRRIGVDPAEAAGPAVRVGAWLLSAERAAAGSRAVAARVAEHDRAQPLQPGIPVGVLAQELGLPAEVVPALVPQPLRVVEGRVLAPRAEASLPPALERALAALARDLADAPFAAPTADRLAELGLDQKAVAAAARAGRVLRVAPGIVLLPGADAQARDRLAELPQPFTTSEARQLLGTSRRVVLPLLDHLDRTGRTRRLPDDRREVRG